MSAPRPAVRTASLLDALGDKRGAAAVEYGLLASLIAVALIIGLTPLGAAIRNLLLQVAGDL